MGYKATGMMFGCLTAGVLLAVGHHLFYASIDQEFVQSSTQQQWFSRVGTGFAFLIQKLLVAAATIAYVQIMWYILRNKKISVSSIGPLLSAFSNLFNFLDLELWIGAPGLILIALILWILPLAGVVAPSALTIESAVNSTIQQLAIPNIDYTHPEKFANMVKMSVGTDTNYSYGAPSIRFTRLISSIAAAGNVPNIAYPSGYVNSSYTIDFYGPALSCTSLGVKNEGLQAVVNDMLSTYMESGTQRLGTNMTLGYISFVKDYGGSNTANLFNLTIMDALKYNVTSYPASYNSGWDDLSDACSVYVSILNTLLEDTTNATWPTLQCGLYNASYEAEFAFSSGQQAVTITDKKNLNSIDCEAEYGLKIDQDPYWGSHFAGISIIDMLNQYLVGTIGSYASSYYASNSNETVQEKSSFSTFGDTTKIGYTVLAEAQEIQNVYTLMKLNSTPSTIGNISFASAIEEVVQNITLGLFSDSYFLQNSSDASLRPVSVHLSQNIYAYTATGRRNLALAYGLSAGATALLVAISIVLIARCSGTTPADVSFPSLLLVTRKMGASVNAVVNSQASGASSKKATILDRMQVILGPNEPEKEPGARNTLDTFAVIDEGQLETSQGSGSKGFGFVGMRRRKGQTAAVAEPLMHSPPSQH